MNRDTPRERVHGEQTETNQVHVETVEPQINEPEPPVRRSTRERKQHDYKELHEETSTIRKTRLETTPA